MVTVMATPMNTHRTRVKICGLRRAEHVHAAVVAGADALGFVFYPPSPRAVAPEDVAELVALVPPFVQTVGLVVNPNPAELEQWVQCSGVDMLQFHGDETPEFCHQVSQQAGVPFFKAIRMKPGLDLEAELPEWHAARGILLDAWHPELPGGTGKQFDWAKVPERWRSRIILAGGLTPGNVGEAIRTVQPYAVDVSGGVEAEKGVKDTARIQAFLAAVRQEDNRHDRQ